MAAILVVEDERVVARDIQESLLRMGYDVIGTAASSAECLAHAEERRPDLVLMDIRIEGALDGIETARILRSRYGVPVIFLTAYADEQTVARAKETEAHGYILKPFRAGELRSAVEIALFKHEMETRLKLREHWFATTLRAIGDAVMAVDRDGRVNFANPVAESLLGSSSEEIVGRALPEVFRPIDERTRAPIPMPSPKDVASGKSTPLATGAALVGPTGEHPIEDSLSPIIDDKGQLLGAVIVFRDVSETRKLRERVALSERMASLGTLAAGVAHEINNPLGAVLLNLHMASKELGTVAPVIEDATVLTDLRAELQDALEAAERVGSIVRDLRIFSRSDEEKRGPVDVRRVVESCLRMASNEIRHRARLVTQLGNLPPVLANESRLGQVFLNLIVNAAQAIPEGKANENEIRIIAVRNDDEWVSVEIADTGSGMAPEVLRRLFTPFFTTKPVGVGTGLGLSICHRIITALGGKITVESTVGHGTSFLVVLPVAKDDFVLPIERPSLSAPPSSRRGRVLVVDDEPLAASAARRCLSGEHDVVVTGSALDAIERISAGERFDAIICDLMMPQVTGMDLYSELGRIAPELAERMIFLTGGAFTQHAREFLERVNTPRLEKPFNPETLRSLINERVR